MKINSVENKRCQLYMKQEKQINKYYSEKKENFKNFIEEQYLEFDNKLSNFKLFCMSVSQYNEVIQASMENYQKLVSNFNPIIHRSIPILMELRKVLNLQQDAEKEKYERLNLSTNFEKLIAEFENKGKNILNLLNEKCDEYLNIIDILNLNHLSYLRNFYDFEIKMIQNETNTNTSKEKEKENLVSTQPKDDTFLVSLHNKENQYKTNLDNANKEIKTIYGIIDINNYELNNIYKEMQNIMDTYLNNIHLGYVSSIKMQQIFETKFLHKNNNNSGEINNNKKSSNKTNNSNINNAGNNKNSKLEKIGQEIKFESYNLLSPYANITGYKIQNKILEKLKPEIIYKISCLINSEFNYISKVDLKEQYRIIDVKLICQKLVDSTKINKKEEEQFYEYLEERNYRLAFLAELNNIRSAGKCHIKKKSLIILGNAYRIIVDKLTKEIDIDYDILKYLIIMSQTYYALGINGKDKIYLIRFIEDSPYFKSEQLWNIYISQEIEQELEKQNSSNMWNLESDENEEFRLNQIYFGKFISFTQNLILFRYDKKFIYKIIHNLIDTKYKISQDFIKQIDALIENAVYDKAKKFEPEKDILE